MNMRRWMAVAVAALLAGPVAAGAQGDTTTREAPPPPHGPPGGRGMERMRFQREIRQAFTRAVREQVGLSDDQIKKLAPINQKYEHERQQIAQEERQARMQLRDELARTTPDENRVAQLSDQLQTYPRKRLDVNDAEDKDLGGIMTPVQLARYRALQERVQRQINMMRPPFDMGPPSDSMGRRGHRGPGG